MEKTTTKFMNKLNKLSPQMQDAIFWITDNIDFVNHICGGRPMPKSRWEKCMGQAIKKGDDFGICLLAFKHIKDRERSRRKIKNNVDNH